MPKVNICPIGEHSPNLVTLVLTKNGLGYILGHFYTNSSGRTGLCHTGKKIIYQEHALALACMLYNVTGEAYLLSIQEQIETLNVFF
jgi:hypothetical protein